MTHYEFTPQNVCCRHIEFDINNGRLSNVRFVGGCHGNLMAIGKLVEGADALQVAQTLRGNDCGGKGTSCADQLAKAITMALGK